jgi:hypothetical protein
MQTTHDRTGQVIKRLTVLGPTTSYQRGTAWRCRCACGREVVVPEGQMHFRASCGCVKYGYKNLTIEQRLRLAVSYDPNTGEFTRLAGGGKRPAGTLIDGQMRRGYVRIFACGRTFLAHRVAWFFAHGEWPSKHIDHINGDPSDNRIGNLRLADVWQNRANSRKSEGKRSRFKGVTYRGDTILHWHAKITKQGAVYRLGMFATEEEAHAAYTAKAKELFGEFARAA